MAGKQQHTHAHEQALEKRQQGGRYSIHFDQTGVESVVPPCGSMQLSWTGGIPPYTLQGRWWPVTGYHTDATARSWTVASNLSDNQYEWMATVPDNSTVFLDAYDSVLNFSDTLLYQVSYTGIPDSNSTWCLSRYPEAAAASPGVALPPLQSATSGANQTITPTQYVDTSGTIAGLWISVGVVSLAFLILLFLHIRLKRRFTRAKRGQATIGKWSKRHFDDDAKELDTDKPWESFTISKPKATTLSLLPSRKNRSLHTFSGESFFNSQSARTSRLSSFFENRSASRTGQTTTNGNHTTRRPSEGSSAINPFEEGDYSEILSTSGRSDTTYDNNTSSKRHSTAETTISQANTVQSGTESHFSSSAHSEQASTIGGSSAISDEYYHRKKATTISPLSSKPTGKPFLDPGMASSSPRQ